MHLSYLLMLILMVHHATGRIPYRCNDLKNIISSCACEALVKDGVEDITQVVLNCRNIALNSVPTVNGQSDYVVYELTLNNNNIQTIPANAFTGLRIQRLDLLNNRLMTIDVNAFKGLENDLLELRVGSDKGGSVQFNSSSLSSLTALQLLHLENFRLSSDSQSTTMDGRLKALTSLRTLLLINNNLRYIPANSVPSNINSLTIAVQSLLTTVPQDMLRNLTSLKQLTITSTNIASIPPNAFMLNTMLETLDLGSNRLSTLNPNCFNGIAVSLQQLNLRSNSITDFSPLSALSSLQSLDLSYGQLQSLPTLPQNRAVLQSLILEGNQLTSVGSLSGMSALKFLNLAHNRLQLSNTDLSGVSKLEFLDLSNQTLAADSKLSLPTSMALLTSLKTLNISGTPLEPTSAWSRISALTSLSTLILDSTGLTSVKDYALKNLTKLQSLSLSKNGLTTITQPMMAGPVGLTFLSLVDNQISSINQCAFYGYALSPPLNLLLSGNRQSLQCNCDLEWILRDKADNRLSITGLDCANLSPADYQPNDFCKVYRPPPSCLELYTTTTSPPTTTTPNLSMNITLVSVNDTTITVTWTVRNLDVQNFYIKYTELISSNATYTEAINKAARQYQIKSLKSSTGYSVCIYSYSNGTYTHTCLSATTSGDNKTVPVPGGLTNQEKGIIAGVVVGGVVLIALVAVILYLVLTMHKKPDKKDQPAPPVQPHTFTPSELPTMRAGTAQPTLGNQSRQFTRPPKRPAANGVPHISQDKKAGPKVGRALENINVHVISDGRTSPASRVSDGSYQYLSEKQLDPDRSPTRDKTGLTGGVYYDMDAKSGSFAQQPRGSAARSYLGYHNEGFKRDSESESEIPPSYSSIV